MNRWSSWTEFCTSGWVVYPCLRTGCFTTIGMNRFTRFCSSSLRMAIEWTQRLWSLQINAVLKIFSRTGDSPYRPQTCSHTGESTSLIPFSRWSVEAMTRAMLTCTKSLWTKFQVNFWAISSSKFFGMFFTSHGFDVFLLRSSLTPNGNRTPGATVLPKSRGTGKSLAGR